MSVKKFEEMVDELVKGSSIEDWNFSRHIASLFKMTFSEAQNTDRNRHKVIPYSRINKGIAKRVRSKKSRF